jgi:hypothetical protein
MTEAETSFFIQRSWEISCNSNQNVLTLLQHSLRGTRQIAPPLPHPALALRAHRPALMLDYKKHSRGLTS